MLEQELRKWGHEKLLWIFLTKQLKTYIYNMVSKNSD